MMAYNHDAHDIYRQSFAIIRSEADLSGVPEDMEKVAIRIAHTCGMVDVIQDLRFSPDAGKIGRSAIAAGAPILCDCQMVYDGIMRSRLHANNQIVCTLKDPEVPGLARTIKNTRSAAAVDLWRPNLTGAVVVIGNAPTALFRLLELLNDGASKPALIIGCPVGFVGAAEAKEALISNHYGAAYIAIQGRRGGSAMAAAAVNALASERHE
ncbi:Precorrin-8X methylmutase [Azospirillaceae bacterium]